MLTSKEKIISIINSLPDEKDEEELVEELLIRLMLERSREQFKNEEYIEHETVRKELLCDKNYPNLVY
ncbi:MAG: hypothetical protein AB1546_04190 [bacterium]